MRTELKWNFLFSVALGVSRGSFIRGDTEIFNLKIKWVFSLCPSWWRTPGKDAKGQSLGPDVVRCENSPQAPLPWKHWVSWHPLVVPLDSGYRQHQAKATAARFLHDYRFSLPAFHSLKKVSSNWHRWDLWLCSHHMASLTEDIYTPTLSSLPIKAQSFYLRQHRNG